MEEWKMNLLPLLWGPFLAAQFVLVLFFGFYNDLGYYPVLIVGWIVWVVSMIFAWAPILIFKRKGGVEKGKSFVHTKVLVDTGLYSIIRHPQYTSGILFSIALILISQSWLIAVLGSIVIVFVYLDTIIADRHELEKFGEDYRDYMRRVPRTNFIWGMIRLLIRRVKAGREK
jgi:protein-S-isoprenylcysteine O-methyltransferase Ste14